MWLVAWDRYALAAQLLDHQMEFKQSLLHEEVVISVACSASAGGRSDLLGVLYDELARSAFLVSDCTCLSSVLSGRNGRTFRESSEKALTWPQYHCETRFVLLCVLFVRRRRLGCQEIVEEAKSLWDKLMGPKARAPKGAPKTWPKGQFASREPDAPAGCVLVCCPFLVVTFVLQVLSIKGVVRTLKAGARAKMEETGK